MCIIRSPKKNTTYTIILNKILQKKGISTDALGVLCYLLSMPDNWNTRITNLMHHFSIGRDKAYSIVNELEKLGHLKKYQLKSTKGQFSSFIYDLIEDPQALSPRPENPEADIQPLTENQEPVKIENNDTIEPISPLPEKPNLIINNILKNTLPLTPSKSESVDKGKERDIKINKLEEELRSIFPKDRLGGGDISAVMNVIDSGTNPEDVIAAARIYIHRERTTNSNGRYIRPLHKWLGSELWKQEDSIKQRVFTAEEKAEIQEKHYQAYPWKRPGYYDEFEKRAVNSGLYKIETIQNQIATA